MRRFLIPLSIFLPACLLLLSCAGSDQPAPESEEMASTPAMVSPADFAGTWELNVLLEGTPDPVPAVLESSDGMMWTLTLPNRDPMQTDSYLSGDSLVVQSPEYESVLRDGVMVSTRSAVVLQGERMIGHMVATYRTAEGAERVHGTMEGARASM